MLLGLDRIFRCAIAIMNHLIKFIRSKAKLICWVFTTKKQIKYPYKIVDIVYSNSFAYKLRSQVTGKNIIFDETLEELIARDEELLGYSPSDANKIIQALYDWKYSPRYKLQAINYERNGNVFVFMNLISGKSMQFKSSEIMNETEIIDKTDANTKIFLFHQLVQDEVRQRMQLLKGKRFKILK